MNIIGRQSEQNLLRKAYRSKQAEFIAVYGRRRVGKTYLINQCFEKADIYFYLTGQQKAPLKTQLHNFAMVYNNTFKPLTPLPTPANWHEAFACLNQTISRLPKAKKVVLFFDELPWLSSKRSHFISALEYFWNTAWSQNAAIKLIVCGSAASWMIKKIIDAKGGLHNRITQRLRLKPFNLSETKSYLLANKIKLSHTDVTTLYMVTGGIPYYLNHIQRDQSVTQNINRLCFTENGALVDEFSRLYRSLFESAELNMSIIKLIAKHRYGRSRKNLLADLKLHSGSKFNDRIDELIAAGFIQKFVPFGFNKKAIHYQVVDEYSLFYLQWIAPHRESHLEHQKNYWQLISRSPQFYTWSGLAFEAVCYKHIQQIANNLELNNIAWQASTWRTSSEKNQAQIDLLFDRLDNTITLIEIKCSSTPYQLNRDEALKLLERADRFKAVTKTKKHIQIVLMSFNDVKTSAWLDEAVDKVMTLDALFTLI